MSNTEIAKQFHDVFETKDYAAFDRIIADDFVSHMRGPPDNGKPHKQNFLDFLKAFPDVRFEVLKTAAEGDLVFLYCKMFNAPGGSQILVDIYRFENSKIVEHWCVGEPLEGRKPDEQA